MNAAFQSGFASALLDVAFNRVTDIIIAELKKMKDVDAAIGKIETTILQAQNLLNHNQVDTFKLEGNIKRVFQQKLDNLTELCYKIEDITDEISIIIAAHHNDSESCNKPILKSIWKSPKHWMKAHNIPKVQDKLDAILKELEALTELTSQSESRIGLLSTHRKRLNSEMILPLRKSDVDAIVQELISGTSKSHGVSIVGIDGLGKTVLAQTIQSEATIAARFSRILWVDLVDCFNADQIIKQLDELQTNGSYCKPSPSCRGHESVLIVFDNLLKVTLDDWNSFWSHLRTRGINGVGYTNVKLLITTFNARVATHTGTNPRYLKPLSDEMCQKLIIATAQSHNHTLTDIHLEHAGLLAKISDGLPSVATILGVFLALYDETKVCDVLNGGLWDSHVFKKEIFMSLKPSYARIQSQSKQCLTYFSLFHPSYAFTFDDLLHLWIGEGFIQESKGTPSLLEAAKEHFTDLLGMSIIRLSDQMTPAGMTKYELNPFGHKFAKLAASRTCMQLTQGVTACNISTRHLSYKDTDFSLWERLRKAAGLRTCLSLGKSNINPIPPSTFKDLTCLRVLSLTQTNASKLPNSIKYLKRLRYLDISHTLIETLPESLSELHTLQFLKLVKDEGGLEYLPKDFHKLTNMLCVDWRISDIKKMGLPSNIGKLSSLQTLPFFPVGEGVGHCISELSIMDNLQGSICISNLNKIRDWATAKTARLDQKSSLEEIELEWMSSENRTNARNVLTCLQPHKNLKRLKITNYYGDAFPHWMMHFLPKLEKLHLHNCAHIQVLPELGFIPALKVLILEEFPAIVEVGQCFFGQGNFPKLESLVFNHFEQLEHLQAEFQNVSPPNAMPCLSALKFIDCPKLLDLSSLKHLPALVELQFERCCSLSSLPDIPISLESLTIRESDQLSINCGEGGDYWPIVDCVRNLEIDYVKIPTSGSSSLPSPTDQQEQISTSDWRGYQIIKDGVRVIARWFGSDSET